MSDLKMCVLLVVSVVTLAMVGWTISSYFEKVSYEELTGKKVTLRQAMFLQLRVQENVR